MEAIEIKILCQSDDKMESLINKFASKANINKEEYVFLFKGKVAELDSNVEEIGIKDNNIIIVVKKNENNIPNLFLNISNENKYEPKINVRFSTPSGKGVNRVFGLNTSIKEALIQYCKEENKDSSFIRFIYNGQVLNPKSNQTFTQLCPNRTGMNITVLDCMNIHGA